MGSILVISPFNLKPGKRAEFATWLKKNDKAIHQAIASVGGVYRGTYASSFGLAPYDGIFLTEYSSFEDFDVWRESNDPNLSKVMTDLMAFTERGPATQIFEPAPEAFEQVVVRKHAGKRSA